MHDLTFWSLHGKACLEISLIAFRGLCCRLKAFCCFFIVHSDVFRVNLEWTVFCLFFFFVDSCELIVRPKNHFVLVIGIKRCFETGFRWCKGSVFKTFHSSQDSVSLSRQVLNSFTIAAVTHFLSIHSSLQNFKICSMTLKVNKNVH